MFQLLLFSLDFKLESVYSALTAFLITISSCCKIYICGALANMHNHPRRPAQCIWLWHRKSFSALYHTKSVSHLLITAPHTPEPPTDWVVLGLTSSPLLVKWVWFLRLFPLLRRNKCMFMFKKKKRSWQPIQAVTPPSPEHSWDRLQLWLNRWV